MTSSGAQVMVVTSIRSCSGCTYSRPHFLDACQQKPWRPQVITRLQEYKPNDWPRFAWLAFIRETGLECTFVSTFPILHQAFLCPCGCAMPCHGGLAVMYHSKIRALYIPTYLTYICICIHAQKSHQLGHSRRGLNPDLHPATATSTCPRESSLPRVKKAKRKAGTQGYVLEADFIQENFTEPTPVEANGNQAPAAMPINCATASI